MRIKYLILLLFISMSLTIFAQKNEPKFDKPAKLLVFSKTMRSRHASTFTGIKMLFELSQSQNWIITATEDASAFNEDILPNFDAVIFLNPSGDALTETEQAAFEKFMKSGKGMIGIHAAAVFEYDWPFYGHLLGGYFKTHPPVQEATIIFENFDHPAMKPFEGMKSYTTVDEWYSFRENPRSKVHVLGSLDENTIKKYENDDWRMGDHPFIWWQEVDNMRSFYTGFGHTHEAFQDKNIIEHIKNAINWAVKRL